MSRPFCSSVYFDVGCNGLDRTTIAGLLSIVAVQGAIGLVVVVGLIVRIGFRKSFEWFLPAVGVLQIIANGLDAAGRLNSGLESSFYLLDKIDGSLAMSSLLLFLLYITLICRRLLLVFPRPLRISLVTILTLSLLAISTLSIINISLTFYMTRENRVFVGFKSVKDALLFIKVTRGILPIAIGDLSVLLILCAKVGYSQKSEKLDLAIVAFGAILGIVHGAIGYKDPTKELIYTRKALFLAAYVTFSFGSLRRNKPPLPPKSTELTDEKLSPNGPFIFVDQVADSYVSTYLTGSNNVPQIRFQGLGRANSWGGLSTTLRSPLRNSIRTDRTGSWQFLADEPSEAGQGNTENLEVPNTNRQSVTTFNFLRLSSTTSEASASRPPPIQELERVDIHSTDWIDGDHATVLRSGSRGQRVRVRTGSLKSFKALAERKSNEPATPTPTLPKFPPGAFQQQDPGPSRPLSLDSMAATPTSGSVSWVTSPASIGSARTVMQHPGTRIQSYQASIQSLPPFSRLIGHKSNPSGTSTKLSSRTNSNLFTELANEDAPIFTNGAFVQSPDDVYNPYQNLGKQPVYFPRPPSAKSGDKNEKPLEAPQEDSQSETPTPRQDKFISINVGDGERESIHARSESMRSKSSSSSSSGGSGGSRGRVAIATPYSGRGSRTGGGMVTSLRAQTGSRTPPGDVPRSNSTINVISSKPQSLEQSFPSTPQEAYDETEIGIAIAR